MSVAGVHRVHGIGAVAVDHVPRRQLGAFERDFANARRPQVSWQALAKMLSCNEHDLRRLCGVVDVVAIAAPSKAGPSSERYMAVADGQHLRAGTKSARLLLALVEEKLTAPVLGNLLDITTQNVATYADRLRRRGLITPTWEPTRAGQDEAARLRGETLPNSPRMLLRFGSKQVQALALISQGHVGRWAIAAHLDISGPNASNLVSTLREKGLIKLDGALTVAGEVELSLHKAVADAE